jgi:hypothetical protein
VIGFSGQTGDYILVEEDLTAVAAEIDRADGLVGVTIQPGQDRSFRAGTAYVNPARVAYLRDPAAPAPAPAPQAPAPGMPRPGAG